MTDTQDLRAARLDRQEEHLHAMCDRLEAVVEALRYVLPPTPPTRHLELVASKREGDDG